MNKKFEGKARVATAKVFDICHITENEFTEGEDDCILVGINTVGGTIAVVADKASPVLPVLRDEMDRNPRGIVSVIMLRGEIVSDGPTMDRLAAQTGRNVEFALRGIISAYYLDGDDNKISVRVSRRGRRIVNTEPRFVNEANTAFFCLNCHNNGETDCRRVVEPDAMDEVKVNGRVMTMADCSVCGILMTRTGGAKALREKHGGISERTLFYEPPETAYCFSCRRNVKMIWIKPVRFTAEQPRPSYRANCFRCLGIVGSPWTRTKLVPVKQKTLEKLRSTVDAAQEALAAERGEAAEKRHAEYAKMEAVRIQDGLARLQYRFAS